MCTIIVANHHYKEFPLVIAANRDEDYNRPATPVQILAREPHLIVGGKDESKGGTWLGVNKHSLFVGITNQGDKNAALASRGLIVMDALKCKSLDELVAFVEELNPAKYNKFNLVIGNAKHLFIAHSYILHSMVIRELPPGVHVVSSDMKFKGESDANAYIHETLNDAANKPWLSYYKTLKYVLANSDYKIKIRAKKKDTGKVFGHCTVSSSILAFSDEGLVRYKFNDRTIPRPKKKEGEPATPRYKDYIDMWRNPDAPVMAVMSEEKDDKDDEDLSPKELIEKVLQSKSKSALHAKLKMIREGVLKKSPMIGDD